MKSNMGNNRANALCKGVEDGFNTNGLFDVYHNGVLVVCANKNIVPAAFRSYALKAALAGYAQVTSYFLAPFINDVEPDDTLTAANFETTLDEFTAYAETSRRSWAQDAEASQAIANAAVMATITVNADGVIRGIALLSNATKGSTAGILAAASLFPSERNVLNGDTLQFKYTMRNQAAA